MADADLIYLSDVEDETEAGNPRNRKSYSNEFKLKVVKHAETISNNNAAKKFGITRSTVIDWRKTKDQLKLQSESSPVGKAKKRLAGGGRKLTFVDLDNQLAQWVRQHRLQKHRISRRIIQQQGERMFNAELDEGQFKASIGWLDKFLKRHNFRLRVPTTVCQKAPQQYAQKLVDFIMYVSEQRRKNNYQSIFACDETAVWLDPAGGKCIDELGAKEVSVLTTGHDKMHVTVMLTADSNGRKLKPYVLLPRKRPDVKIIEKYKNKLNLSWAGRTWMDDSLTGDYLQQTFGRSLFGKRLLVWDAFRCHISEATKQQLRKQDIHVAVVPGGCTKYIQAPDVVWNSPFKAKLQELYNLWIMNEDRMEWTKNGNRRPASMDVYLGWICTAWDSLSNEMIAKSFKDCGITVCHDGSEDDKIHGFKAHGQVPEGLLMLQDARAWLDVERNQFEEADPEQDEENGYLSDGSLNFDDCVIDC